MLGARLRVIRKKKAYTLAEVGNQTGLSVSFLSDIERGRTQPSLDTLEKLSNCYQVPLNDMLDNMDGDALASGQAYPPGFDEFLRDTEIEPELVDLLLKVCSAPPKLDRLENELSCQTTEGKNDTTTDIHRAIQSASGIGHSERAEECC